MDFRRNDGRYNIVYDYQTKDNLLLKQEGPQAVVYRVTQRHYSLTSDPVIDTAIINTTKRRILNVS